MSAVMATMGVATTVMRIEAVWLALGASDLRGGIDVLLAQVLRGFGQGVQAHHAYVFANRRADRLKVLLYDGAGMWLCTRRLQSGGFAWPRENASGTMALTREQFDWLVAGLPWQRLCEAPSRIKVV
jgi:transposase